MTLALLLTAVGGAWAQDDPEGTPTVSVSDLKYEGGLYFYEVTATAKQAYGMDTEVKYTTDGTTPTENSPAYTGPIKCYKNQTVKFQAFLMGSTIPGAAKDATITFSFEGPTITVDGAKVTISTNLNNATTYYKLNGGDAVEGTEVTLTQSATVTAYVVVTNGTYANFTSSESSKEVTLQDEPTVEVTTNAAEGETTFTEATFAMPAYDATAEYELVRDITQGVDVEVRIDGAATERIRIAKDTEGYYQFVTKQYWQFAAVDKLDNNKDLTNGEMIYSFKKKVDDDYEAVDTRYDLCPGTWRLQAEANPEKPYDGIAYGSNILLYDFKEITFPKGYSTHYYNESLVLDEICNSLKFYAVTAVTSEKVTLTEITSKAIPSQTPFIVYNETPEPITAVMGMLMADVVTSAEQFKGTAEDKNMGSQSNCYVLRNGDSTPTFRLVKGAGTLPAHRCYIDLGAAAGTRSLGFDFGDGTTGIDSVESGELKVDSLVRSTIPFSCNCSCSSSSCKRRNSSLICFGQRTLRKARNRSRLPCKSSGIRISEYCGSSFKRYSIK